MSDVLCEDRNWGLLGVERGGVWMERLVLHIY